MTKQENERRLARAVVALQASSMPAWAEFMGALAERIDIITEQFVATPPGSDLNRLQGHAQEARALFKQLNEARKLVEDLQAKGNSNGTAPR